MAQANRQAAAQAAAQADRLRLCDKRVQHFEDWIAIGYDGVPPEALARLKRMFAAVQPPFLKYCEQNPTRTSFPCYAYVCHKLCELCDEPHLAQRFWPPDKPWGREKLGRLDAFWRFVCTENGWVFT